LKRLFYALIPIFLLAVVGGAYYYSQSPKLGDVYISGSIDSNGGPEKDTIFMATPTNVYQIPKGEKSIFVSVKVVNPFTRTVTIKCSLGDQEIASSKDIPVGKTGYATMKIDLPDQGQDGVYTVSLIPGKSVYVEAIASFRIEK
jgi:hypothetical protein